MQLRPHHLLCTQGYEGKGYNKSFTDNMDQVVHKLRSEEATEIELVFTTDSLCSACPHQVDALTCDTNEKVMGIDQKVIKYFGLEEKKYIYQQLIKEIDEKMTAEMMEDICGACSWYPVSACKGKIVRQEK